MDRVDRVLDFMPGALMVAFLLGVVIAMIDSFGGNVTESSAVVTELFVEQEGGIGGGADHIVVVATEDGRRIGVYVGYRTYYSLVMGQQVTLQEKRGKWTGWYVSDRIVP